MQIAQQFVGVPPVPHSTIPAIYHFVPMAPGGDLAMNPLIRPGVAQVMEQPIFWPEHDRPTTRKIPDVNVLDFLYVHHHNWRKALPWTDHVLRRLPIRVHMHSFG